MSDYHVLENNEVETLWNVVFHIPVPAVTNAVGYAVRTIMIETLNPRNELGEIVSSVPWISGAELIQLQAGELWETRELVPVGLGNTVTQKRAVIEARYNQIMGIDRGELLDRYNFYGFNGTVA